MALTELEIKKAKPEAKPYKMADGGGMYLFIHANGGKYWRMDYRFAGKRKTLAIGVYPDVTLARARERREEARKLLANDTDPSAIKQVRKTVTVELSQNSFEIIAREWFDRHKANWRAGSDTPNRSPWRTGNRPPRPFMLWSGVPLCRGNRTC